MDSIVTKLSEIENAAAAIVEHAEAQKPELERQWQQKRDEFDRSLEEETNKKLNAIKSELEQNMSRLLKKQAADNEAAALALKKEYEQKHEIYAKEILSHIIEV